MAGGKETPRQKMIGLMYLVLTAMLALNVSKQILEGYLSVNESMDKSKRNIEENNSRITKAFEASINGNQSAEPYYNQALIAQKDLQEGYDYLNQVKGNLIRYVLKLPQEVKVLGDTVNLRQKSVKDKIDNYDMPTALLLGPSEHNLKEGPLTAHELRTNLNALHDKLLAQIDKMQKTDGLHLMQEDYDNLKKKIAIIKPTDSGREEDGVKFTWPLDNFYHLPMAAVFVNLQKMQVDLKNVESEILQVFSSASGKLAIKPDRLLARTIAPTSYITSGQKYTSDIFLSAAFTKLGAGDMEVMVGVDSASAAKGGRGTPVPIIGGMGRYEVTTGSQGDQKYEGVIKFKKPDGTFEYYPFSGEYKVAKSAVAVSADMMNVFYAGVVNPVSAGVAGLSPNDVVISATGPGVKYVAKGDGKYDFTFTGPGECNITVSAKTKDGIKPQGPPQKFRVKPLPKPELILSGKFGPTELKKDELRFGGLGAGAPGFEFKANYLVTEWEIMGRNFRDQFKNPKGKGPGLTQEAKDLLANPSIGQPLFFDAVIRSPDGKTHKVSLGVKILK
jgi:gliding motility-associated protein GldM